MNVKNKLYFYHMRKCGGTSLIDALRKYCAIHKMQFGYTEGGAFGFADKYFSQYTPGQIVQFLLNGKEDSYLESFIWVTHLRNPVDRIFSMYLASGDEGSISLDNYIDKHVRHKRKNIYWQITSNYFIKSLLNHNTDVTSAEFEMAVTMLEQMDALFILDQKLKLGKGLFFSLDIRHLRQGNKSRYKKYDDELESCREKVRELNQWDIKLYNFFVEKARQKNDE